MKKTILSLLLIFTFGAYVWHVQSDNEGPVANSPATTSNPAVTIPPPNTTVAVRPVPEPTTPAPVYIPKTVPPPAPKPVPKPAPAPTGKFINGSYTGSSANAFYGNVQVVAVISDGKLTNVQFLDYPQDRSNSARISARAMPILTKEAIAIQDSNVNTVSGATATSAAFRESLSSALDQAKA